LNNPGLARIVGGSGIQMSQEKKVSTTFFSSNQRSLFVVILLVIGIFLTRFFLSQPFLPSETILYLLIFLAGMLFLRQTLLSLYSDSATAISILLLAGATNLLSLLVFETKLFPLICFFLYGAILFFTSQLHQKRNFIILFFLAACIIGVTLLSATGFITLAIPLLWGIHDRPTAIEKAHILKRSFLGLMLVLCIMIAAIIIFVFSCGLIPGEIPSIGLHLPGLFLFGSRYAWNDLFGMNHGLLITTPAILLPIIGFYFLADKKPEIYYSIFIFCLLELILVTCWADLGDTPVFGQIAFVPVLAILILPLTSLTDFFIRQNRWFRILFLLIAALLVGFTTFKGWNYYSSTESVKPEKSLNNELPIVHQQTFLQSSTLTNRKADR
jgi:hypothetical protein